MILFLEGRQYLKSNKSFLVVLIIFTFILSTPIALVEGKVETYEVHVSGNYVYLLMSKRVGFEIIDITDPRKPKVSSFTELDGSECTEICVKDNYAYFSVITGYAGYELQIFDVSDPKNPFKVSSFNTENYIYSIFVFDDFIHLRVGGQQPKILTLSISDIQNPTQVAEFSEGNIRDVIVRENILIITCWENGLRIINFTDSLTYNVLSDYSFTDFTLFFVDGNYVFLADTIRAFDVIDITNLTNPIKICSIDYFDISPISSLCISITNSLLFQVGSEKITIIDVSNPLEPELLSSVDVGISLSSYPDRFFVTEDYAFSTNGKLVIIDLADPINPEVVSISNLYIPRILIRNILLISISSLLVVIIALVLYIKRNEVKELTKKNKRIIVISISYGFLICIIAFLFTFGSFLLNAWFWPVAVFLYSVGALITIGLVVVTTYLLVKKRKEKNNTPQTLESKT